MTISGQRPSAAPTKDELNIGDDRSITAFFMHSASDWIINCAAYTAVDSAEEHRDAAFQINSYGPNWLGRVSQWTDARVLYISTDFVFDGQKSTPYTETDEPNPINVYGESKLQGEKSLMEAADTAVIVRSSWLFGANGKCFPTSIIQAAMQGKELRVVDDQIGIPTYTQDLAGALAHLVEINPEPGIYNVANSGQANWHELAIATLAAADIEANITAISSEEWPAAAKRPKYSVLDCSKFQSLGLSSLPDWRDAVRRFVQELKAANFLEPKAVGE